MKLKLFPYTFELKYLPGKYMYIADYLSRNFEKTDQYEDETLKEMVHVIGNSSITFSKSKYEEIKDLTLCDLTLSTIMKWYQMGWPNNGKNLSDELQHFYKLRKDITLEHDLVFYNEKLVVPKAFRAHILKLAHEGHLGYEKVKDQLCNRFYWPGIKSNLLNMIQSCDVCQSYQRSKLKDPLVSHEIPNVPFIKIGMDFCELGNKSYLVMVDYFSRWIEVFEVSNKNVDTVIKCCKQVFSQFGIPQEIISDHVPFDSYKFKNFAKEWNIDVAFSSPHYSQSNGLAEKAVGMVKNMLKKCQEDNSDISISLLNYRNSPVAGTQFTPAQLLMSRHLRSKLTVRKKELQPSVVKNPLPKFQENQLSQKAYYDKKSTKKRE